MATPMSLNELIDVLNRRLSDMPFKLNEDIKLSRVEIKWETLKRMETFSTEIRVTLRNYDRRLQHNDDTSRMYDEPIVCLYVIADRDQKEHAEKVHQFVVKEIMARLQAHLRGMWETGKIIFVEEKHAGLRALHTPF